MTKQRWSHLLLLIAVACVPPAPPYGYQGGSDPIRFPDGADHWYCMLPGMSPETQADLRSAMQNLDGQTEMYDVDAGPTCATSTDVVWVAAEWGAIDGAYGRYQCVSHSYWGVCDQAWVMFDQTAHFISAIQYNQTYGDDIGSAYELNLNITYRHELGHSAGLHHYQTNQGANPAYGAMVSAWVRPIGSLARQLQFLAYNATQVQQINNFID